MELSSISLPHSLALSLSPARSRCDAVKINLEPRVQFSVLVGHKWEDFSQLIVRNAPDFDFDSELTECHSTVALSTFQFPRPHSPSLLQVSANCPVRLRLISQFARGP